MNCKKFFVFLAAVALTFSCGQQHKAQKTVERFLETYCENKEVEAKVVTFDSTHHLKPDIVERLRQEARFDRRFHAVQYASSAARNRKTPYARVRLTAGEDTTFCTFYFDEQLEGVICFKEN